MPALQMGELRQKIGLISVFLKVTLVQKNSTLRTPHLRSSTSPHSRAAQLNTLGSLRTQNATRHSEKGNISGALPGAPAGLG